LDEFWYSTEPPDATLYAGFRQAVMAATQINGGFYCGAGIDLAVKNSGRVLLGQQSTPHQLL
jgi:capsular polysaccharide export protein